MKTTMATTRPAVLSGPRTGPSHDANARPVTCSEVTTTGLETVPLGTSTFSRSAVMSAIVSCNRSTGPPFPAPRTSAIFARMLTR